MSARYILAKMYTRQEYYKCFQLQTQENNFNGFYCVNTLVKLYSANYAALRLHFTERTKYSFLWLCLQ